MQYLNIMQKIRTAVSGLNGPFEQYPRARERRFYPGTQSIYLLGGFHQDTGADSMFEATQHTRTASPVG